MRTFCVRNALVFGVILLFVGVAVQPAIAVNPISTDNEEDCNICPKVGKQHLVRLKSLINKVETLNNKLSVMFKHNSKVREKYQELSDSITTLTEINKELKPDTSWDDHPIICDILLILGIPFVFMRDEIYSMYDKIEEYSLLWWLMYPIICIFIVIDFIFIYLFVKLNCIEFPPPL